jgi:hypothetical protein
MIRRCLRVGIVMSLGLAASACGKPSGADAVKAAEKLADAICACKDMECVKKVGDDGAKELDKYKSAKPDAKQDAALKAAGLRASDCIGAIGKPPAPAEPPAPPQPPAPAPAAPDAGAAAPPATPAPPK